MIRLLLASLIAIILHALLLVTEADWMKRDPVPMPLPKPLSLSLSYRPTEKKILPVFKQPEPGPELEKVMPAPPQTPREKAVPVKKVPRKTIARQIKSAPLPEPQPASTPETEADLPKETPDEAPDIIIPDPPRFPKNIPMDDRAAGIIKQMPSSPAPAPPREPPVLKQAVPMYSKNPLPQYPGRARRRKQEGVVLLRVLVNSEGTVDDLHISKSSGYDVLDRAAMDAVKGWIFTPGQRGEEAVDMWVQVPVRFELK